MQNGSLWVGITRAAFRRAGPLPATVSPAVVVALNTRLPVPLDPLYPNFIAFGGHGSVNPNDTARYQVRQQLIVSHIALEVKNATELGEPWHCVSGPTTMLSPYSRAGERLFYQRICVAAGRPTESLLASSAPGTI